MRALTIPRWGPVFVRSRLSAPPPYGIIDDAAEYARELEALWRWRGVCTCPAGQPCRRVAQLMQEGAETISCVGNGRIDAPSSGVRSLDRDDEIDTGRAVDDAETNRRSIAQADGIDLKHSWHLTISVVGCGNATIEAAGSGVMPGPADGSAA